ncbi:MAG TPA: DUF6261 family protein [Chitinispirillaceae bacterium]|nr:DUF6261 family protein [Chitinispirillaceae bacterium]
MNVLFSLSTSGLAVAILTTTAMRIIAIVEKYLSGNEFVAGIVAKIKVELENIKAASARGRSSSYTELIAEKDQKRDERYNGLVCLIKSKMLMTDDPDVTRAAEVVLHSIEKLGTGVVSKSYSRQTQLLSVLFQELESEQVAAAITTLNIETEVGLLRTAQQEFEDAVQKKNEEISSRAGQSSVVTYSNLRKYLSALLDHIAFNASEDVSPFTEAVPELNEVITIAKASIGSGGGSGGNEPPESEDFQETMTTTES